MVSAYLAHPFKIKNRHTDSYYKSPIFEFINCFREKKWKVSSKRNIRLNRRRFLFLFFHKPQIFVTRMNHSFIKEQILKEAERLSTPSEHDHRWTIQHCKMNVHQPSVKTAPHTKTDESIKARTGLPVDESTLLLTMNRINLFENRRNLDNEKCVHNENHERILLNLIFSEFKNVNVDVQ